MKSDHLKLKAENDQIKKKTSEKEKQLKAREQAVTSREINQNERDEQLQLLKNHCQKLELTITDLEEQNKLLKLKLLTSEEPAIRSHKKGQTNEPNSEKMTSNATQEQMNAQLTSLMNVIQASILANLSPNLTNLSSSQNQNHVQAPRTSHITNAYQPSHRRWQHRRFDNNSVHNQKRSPIDEENCSYCNKHTSDRERSSPLVRTETVHTQAPSLQQTPAQDDQSATPSATPPKPENEITSSVNVCKTFNGEHKSTNEDPLTGNSIEHKQKHTPIPDSNESSMAAADSERTTTEQQTATEQRNSEEGNIKQTKDGRVSTTATTTIQNETVPNSPTKRTHPFSKSSSAPNTTTSVKTTDGKIPKVKISLVKKKATVTSTKKRKSETKKGHKRSTQNESNKTNTASPSFLVNILPRKGPEKSKYAPSMQME